MSKVEPYLLNTLEYHILLTIKDYSKSIKKAPDIIQMMEDILRHDVSNNTILKEVRNMKNKKLISYSKSTGFKILPKGRKAFKYFKEWN